MSDFFAPVDGPPSDDRPGTPSVRLPPGFPPAPGPPGQEPPYLRALPTVAGLAIASLVLGLLWLWGIGSVLAVIFGFVALSQIKRANGLMTGRGMAIAGVVLGWIGIALLVIVVAAIVGAGDESARPAVDASGDVADDPNVLNGVYRAEWTLEELVAAGVPEDTVRQYAMAGVYTWSLDDGELELTSEFEDGSSVECSGTYGVQIDVVNLRLEPPCPTYSFTATWALTDMGLVFYETLLDGQPDPYVDIWMSQKPWAEIDSLR